MSPKAMRSGGIGLVLMIIMIGLVIWLRPMREFPGGWFLLPVVLVVVVVSAVALSRGGGTGRGKL